MTHLPLHSQFSATPQHYSYLLFHQNAGAKIFFTVTNVVFTCCKLLPHQNQTRCTYPRVTLLGTTLPRITYDECMMCLHHLIHHPFFLNVRNSNQWDKEWANSLKKAIHESWCNITKQSFKKFTKMVM